jgi:uncharacterized membrane protein YedE/YeeE
MEQIWLGLLSGIAFGFVIQRVGATNADKMARAHLMIEPQIPQFMLLTVLFAAVGVLGLKLAGIGRFVPLPTSLVATGLAAVIFGIGWGLTGYCPGTCWAAAGEGRGDAFFALLGGLAGTAVFAQFHETLVPLLYMPTNLGQLTLDGLVGNQVLALFLLVIVLAAAVAMIGLLWKPRET